MLDINKCPENPLSTEQVQVMYSNTECVDTGEPRTILRRHTMPAGCSGNRDVTIKRRASDTRRVVRFKDECEYVTLNGNQVNISKLPLRDGEGRTTGCRLCSTKSKLSSKQDEQLNEMTHSISTNSFSNCNLENYMYSCFQCRLATNKSKTSPSLPFQPPPGSDTYEQVLFSMAREVLEECSDSTVSSEVFEMKANKEFSSSSSSSSLSEEELVESEKLTKSSSSSSSTSSSLSSLANKSAAGVKSAAAVRATSESVGVKSAKSGQNKIESGKDRYRTGRKKPMTEVTKSVLQQQQQAPRRR